MDGRYLVENLSYMYTLFMIYQGNHDCLVQTDSINPTISFIGQSRVLSESLVNLGTSLNFYIIGISSNIQALLLREIIIDRKINTKHSCVTEILNVEN